MPKIAVVAVVAVVLKEKGSFFCLA